MSREPGAARTRPFSRPPTIRIRSALRRRPARAGALRPPSAGLSVAPAGRPPARGAARSSSRDERRGGRASSPSARGARGGRGPRSSQGLRAPYGFAAPPSARGERRPAAPLAVRARRTRRRGPRSSQGLRAPYGFAASPSRARATRAGCASPPSAGPDGTSVARGPPRACARHTASRRRLRAAGDGPAAPRRLRLGPDGTSVARGPPRACARHTASRRRLRAAGDGPAAPRRLPRGACAARVLPRLPRALRLRCGPAALPAFRPRRSLGQTGLAPRATRRGPAAAFCLFLDHRLRDALDRDRPALAVLGRAAGDPLARAGRVGGDLRPQGRDVLALAFRRRRGCRRRARASSRLRSRAPSRSRPIRRGLPALAGRRGRSSRGASTGGGAWSTIGASKSTPASLASLTPS